MRRIGRCVNFLTMEFILKMIVAGLLLSQFKLRYIVKNSMTESAKDINSIYSSYNLTQYTYIETTENESYVQVKNKWQVFKANGARNVLSLVRNTQKNSETEAI